MVKALTEEGVSGKLDEVVSGASCLVDFSEEVMFHLCCGGEAASNPKVIHDQAYIGPSSTLFGG